MAEEKDESEVPPHQEQPKTSPEQPKSFKKLSTKSKVPPSMILLAMKGALPTVIALSAYESHKWAEVYTTLGYLVAVISHLSLAIQPRAKYLQAITISVLFTCLGAAVALLEIQCVVSARSVFGVERTGSSGSLENIAYDASSNTIAAVFLFVMIFLANAAKSARPAMTLPLIQFCIFAIVASTYAPSFPTMVVGKAFVRRLLITFLTGQGIATGVSLLIMPITSRGIVEKQIGGMLKLMTGALASHMAFQRSIRSTKDNKPGEEEQQAAQKLQGMIITIQELFGKIKLELGFARKEFAWGKLDGDQYSEVYDLIRKILQPMMGLTTFLQILKATRERRSQLPNDPDTVETLKMMRDMEVEEWTTIMDLSREAYQEYQKSLFQGLSHVGIQLEFEKRPKQPKVDVEGTAGGSPKPGDMAFSECLASEIKKWSDHRNEVLQDWAESRNISLPSRFWSNQMEKPSLDRQKTTLRRQKLNQHQLYLLLYMNFLNASVGTAILNLCRWADARHEDGTMKKKRIINPGFRRIRRLFEGAFEKGNTDETLGADVNGGSNVYLGDALKKRKDAEHLPPRNAYEKITNQIRKIPKLLQSDSAAFGFRCAVAAISIGIIAYLRQTRTFFLRQRVLWAMIMTAISMDPHSGQGLFGFACRVLGTVFAMAVSIAIWWMCDQKHPAILVIFWIYMSMVMVFLLRLPQYAMVAMISTVTVVLVLGYELQVDVIGKQLATSNGQPYYPVQVLAPYRLATVVAGLAVAFIWTFFPYPTTTHGAIRQDVGSALYILANYYSCVHTTLDARLHLGPAINDVPENSPIKKLDAARSKVFGKVLLMLSRLDGHERFTRFEPPFGGRFPKETYHEIIGSIRNIFTYLSLITYSSTTFVAAPEGEDARSVEEEREWLDDFRSFAADTRVTSHELTTTLCLLSSAIRSGQPLPPYLRAVRPFSLGEKISEVDPKVLSVAHFAHPCYAAFAVGEVASAFITAEVDKLTKLAKELVGEVDFSFHVVSTMDDGSSTTSTLWDREDLVNKKKGD